MENLCFIKFVGTDSDGLNVYELLFTDNIEDVWGENWEYTPSCLVRDLMPFDENFNEVYTIKTEIKFKLAQDSCCFNMQDCIDGCVCLACEDLVGYEEYPEDGRLVIHFGVELEELEELLAKKNIVMNKKEEDE